MHCWYKGHTSGAVGTKLLAEVPEVVQIFWHSKLVQLHHLISLLWFHLWQGHGFGFISTNFLHLPIACTRLRKKCIVGKTSTVIHQSTKNVIQKPFNKWNCTGLYWWTTQKTKTVLTKNDHYNPRKGKTYWSKSTAFKILLK